MLSKVPAPCVHPLLSTGREAWLRSCPGNPGGRGRLVEVMVHLCGHSGDSDPDLEAASPGPWEAAGVQGKQAPMESKWYYSGLWNAEAGGAWAGLRRGLRL